ISEENPQLNRASNVPHPATQPVVDVNLQFNAFDERNASDEPVKVPKKRGIKKINPDPGPQVDGDEDGDEDGDGDMRFRFYESASARKRAVTAEERERAINAICQPEPAEAEPQHSMDLDMEDHPDYYSEPDLDFDDPQSFKKTDRKGKRARKRTVTAEERDRTINAICQPEPAEAEPQHSVDLDMEDHTDSDFDFDDPQRFKKTDRKGKRAVAGENGGLLLKLPSLMQVKT
ncbi:B3 domain-containing protein REM19, partial [Linum perenne]